MQTFLGKNIVVISPRYFNYENEIVDEFWPEISDSVEKM